MPMTSLSTWRSKGATALRNVFYTSSVEPQSPTSKVINEHFSLHEYDYLALVGRVYSWNFETDADDTELQVYAQEYFKGGMPTADPLHFIKLSLISAIVDCLHKLHGTRIAYHGFVNMCVSGTGGYRDRVKKRYTELSSFVNAALRDDSIWYPLKSRARGDIEKEKEERLCELGGDWVRKLRDFREYLRHDCLEILEDIVKFPPKNDPDIWDFSGKKGKSPYRRFATKNEADIAEAKDTIFVAVKRAFFMGVKDEIEECRNVVYRLIDLVYSSLSARGIHEKIHADDSEDIEMMPIHDVVGYDDVAVVLISAIDFNWIPDWRANVPADVKQRAFLLCTNLLPKPQRVQETSWLMMSLGFEPAPYEHTLICWLWTNFMVFSDPLWLQRHGIPYESAKPPPQRRWVWTRLFWGPSTSNIRSNGLTHPQKIFSNFDSNFSGRLSAKEFKIALACMGVYEDNPLALDLLQSIAAIGGTGKSRYVNSLSLAQFELWFVRLCRMNGLIRYSHLDLAVQDDSMTLGFASSGNDVMFSIASAILLPILSITYECFYVFKSFAFAADSVLLDKFQTALVGTVHTHVATTKPAAIIVVSGDDDDAADDVERDFYYGDRTTNNQMQKFRMYLSTFHERIPQAPWQATLGAVLRIAIIVLVVYAGVVTTTIYYIRDKPSAGVMTVVEGLGPVIMYVFFVFQIMYFLSPAFSYEYAWRQKYRRADLNLHYFNMRRYMHKDSSEVYRVPCADVIQFISRPPTSDDSMWWFYSRTILVFAIAIIHSCTPQVVRHGWTLRWLARPEFEVFTDPGNPHAESTPSEAAILHFFYGLLYALCMVMITDHFNIYHLRLKRFTSLIHRRAACTQYFPYYLHFQTSGDVMMWSKLRSYVISNGSRYIRRFEGFVGICLLLLFLLAVYFFVSGITGGLTNSPADVSAGIDAGILGIFLINLLYTGAQINFMLQNHIGDISRVQLALKLYNSAAEAKREERRHGGFRSRESVRPFDDNERKGGGAPLDHSTEDTDKSSRRRRMQLDLALSRVIRYMQTNDDYLKIAYITLSYDIFLRLVTGVATAAVSVVAEAFKVTD